MTNEELDAIEARVTINAPVSRAPMRDAETLALIAEVRRLCALPVIATCGACGWSRTLLGGRDCTHGAAVMVIGSASHDPPPPSWCPLRRSP